MKYSILVTILTVASVTTGQDITTVGSNAAPVVNTTADLINVNFIQMERDTDAALRSIDLLQARYEEKVNVVNLNQNSLKDEITQLNAKMDLWETESIYKKECVDKYRKEVTTSKAVQAAVDVCIATGRNKSPVLVGQARAYYNNAVTRKPGFEGEANNCLKSQKGIFNQTSCLTVKIEYWRQVLNSDLLSLNNELDTQLCLSNAYAKQTHQCVATYISSVYAAINKASYKIQACFEGKDETVPCSATAIKTIKE